MSSTNIRSILIFASCVRVRAFFKQYGVIPTHRHPVPMLLPLKSKSSVATNYETEAYVDTFGGGKRYI